MLSATDLIELYHLESFSQKISISGAGSFSFQSTGLALRSSNSETEIVLQFKPLNYSACFLPILGANLSLEWDKRAIIAYSNSLDFDYWQQSTFLGTLNGVVYANFINWVDEYAINHQNYFPYSVCVAPESSECFMTSHTSETFVVARFVIIALSDNISVFLENELTKLLVRVIISSS